MNKPEFKSRLDHATDHKLVFYKNNKQVTDEKEIHKGVQSLRTAYDYIEARANMFEMELEEAKQALIEAKRLNKRTSNRVAKLSHYINIAFKEIEK